MKATLVLLLALCAAVANAQPRCKTLTGKIGCSECRKNVCLYCSKGFGEVWTGTGASLKISSCTEGKLATCGASPGNCAKCVPSPGNPPTCVECKTTGVPTTVPAGGKVTFQKYTSALFWGAGANFGKCVAGNSAAITGNAACNQWNPDGTCKLCKQWNAAGNAAELVVPNNALWTNGVNPMSSCRTRTAIGSLSRTATGVNTLTKWVPVGCAEVGTHFRCMRCKPGFSLVATATSYTCKAPTATQTKQKRSANGCLNSLPFQEYCRQCNPAGTLCLGGQCVPGRSPLPAGYCSLNCKQLYGITCLNCNAAACLTNDPGFPNGRR